VTCGFVVARGGVEPPTFRFSGLEGVMSLMIRGSAAAHVWETYAGRLRTGLRLNPSTVQMLTRCRRLSGA